MDNLESKIILTEPNVIGEKKHISDPHQHRDAIAAKMGMWLFLFTELLLFGGLFVLYMSYRLQYTKDFVVAGQELNLVLGCFNTIVLLTSSLTMALSIAAIQRGKKALSVTMLLYTLSLAFTFLVVKYFEWTAKFHHGIIPGSTELTSRPNGEIIFYGMYFSMTGLHALHVIIGVIILSFMLFFLVRGKTNQNNYIKLENAGLYWHLVDLIWIFLFPLFYLIH